MGRRVRAVVTALACALVLTSCGFNPLSLLPREFSRMAVDRMGEIVEALNAQDSESIKAMFTEYALAEYSEEIDEGLDAVLAMFPDGDVEWEIPDSPLSYGQAFDGGKRLLVVPARFRIRSGGEDYWLFFSYYILNDMDPANVGIYGLGVAPRTETRASGPEQVFFEWSASVSDSVSGASENGPPGVYRAEEDVVAFSDLMMRKIIDDDLNIQDRSGLRETRFSSYVQSRFPEAIDDEVDAVFDVFPDGGLTWEPLTEDPVVQEAVEGDDRTLLLLSRYRVTSATGDWWLVFADFTVNEIDPDNLGLYALGVAPRTVSEDSAAEVELFAWLETFDVAATTPPGILILP